MPERWEKTAEQLDNLAALYEANGVKVYRPGPYQPRNGVTLQIYSQVHPVIPADPVYPVGTHYIEVNIRRAYRRKEVFPLRDVVLPLIEGVERTCVMPQRNLLHRPAGSWALSGRWRHHLLQQSSICR
ncbi:MAG: hypothetical protein CM1200mP18_00370 [Gammaproteobacteria bacterium]|nr:MAG: hypothetical protein CM1200mP18_00370 [Gammaproteobacteria bacterium]